MNKSKKIQLEEFFLSLERNTSDKENGRVSGEK
jgi:hypothetical protein